jgi:hypothetical protein
MGAIAGSATVLITNPIWVINTRMTARKSEAEETLPRNHRLHRRKLFRGSASLDGGLLKDRTREFIPIITVLITNPIWVINTRMTARKSEAEETLPGAKKPKAHRRKLFRGSASLDGGLLKDRTREFIPIIIHKIGDADSTRSGSSTLA